MTATAVPPATESVPGIPLQALVDTLGASLLRVHTAPDGLDVAVHDIVIADPLGDLRAQGAGPGDVVIGVGVDVTRPEAISLLAAAGAAHAVAVCLRATAVPPAAVATAATDAGVALILVEPELAWSQLHVLLRSARAAVGSAPVDGAAGVGDLFALADALAALVGGPVTIEDPRSTVLAYSRDEQGVDEPRRRTILGRKVPTEWQQRLSDDGVFRRLWASDDIVRTSYDGAIAPRLAVAVRAGGEVLGSIWAAERDRAFDEAAEAALREAARVAALHLLRHRSSDDLERRRRSDQLRAVLDGRLPTALVHESLGVPPHLPVTVIALRLRGLDGAGAVATAERGADVVALHCRAYRRPAATVANDDTIHVVVPGPFDRGEATTLARELVERVQAAVQAEVVAGVSGAERGPDAAADARVEAEAALHALALSPERGPVAHVDAVRPHVVLAAVRAQADRDPGLLAGRVAILAQHDEERATQYVETLRALLDAFGDVRAAAEAMQIHPNTFRYRVRRLLDVAGLDIDDPVERVVAHLQLHLMSRTEPAHAPLPREQAR